MPVSTLGSLGKYTLVKKLATGGMAEVFLARADGPGGFAKNDIAFHDPTGVDHDALGGALKKAIYNYMHGIGLEQDVRSWFPFKVPKTTVAKNRIERALRGA